MAEVEDDVMRKRRERLAAWKASEGGTRVAEEGVDAAVEKMNAVVGGLAAAQEARKEFVKAVDVPAGVDRGGRGVSGAEITRIEPRGWMEWANQASGKGGAAQGWKQTVGGLGGLSEKYGSGNNVTNLIIAREKELEATDGDYCMDINQRPDQSIDTSRCVIATMDEPIPSDNLGHRMLLKMGWKGLGSGLGRGGRGIYDPIPLTNKDMMDIGSRVGVGRIQEEDEQHQVATEKRLLESELQANESEERRQTREEKVERDERIRDEVSEIVSIFRCDVCNKQYATDDQYQEHLNSYDHHHKKRFADFQREAKAMKGGPSKDERQRKEQKRLEKEMAARAEALKQAASSSSTSGAQPPPPPPPPPPTASGDVQPPAPPPPDAQPGGELPQGGGSLKIGFSMKPLSGGGKKPAGMVMKKPAGAAKRPAAMAFGDDSD